MDAVKGEEFFQTSGESNDLETQVANHLIRLADMSYSAEEARGESCEKLAAHLLTGVTILSAALLAPAPALFQYYAETGTETDCFNPALFRIKMMYLVVFCLLFGSFITALISQMFRKSNALDSPQKQAEAIEDDVWNNPFTSALSIAVHHCDALQPRFDGMLKKHDRATVLLKASMALIIAATITVMLCAIILAFEFS